MTEIKPEQRRKKLAWLTGKLWVLGAFVIVAALLGHAVIGMRYFQRISEGEVLAYETSEATRYLNKLDNPRRRQTRTNESEARLKELQAQFPKELSGPSTMTRLLLLAERFNLQVEAIEIQPGSGNEIGTNIYNTLSIEVGLEGDITSLREFLAELEDGYIAASRLDRLDIKDLALVSQSSAGQHSSLNVTLMMSVFARVESIDQG